MREHRGPIAPCIQNGYEQADGPARALGQRRSLELGCSQLSLEIQERPLDLHGNHSSRTIEHEVNCPPIRRNAHGHLQLHPPIGRCSGPDCLRDLQLPGVAQADAVGRIEAKDQIVAAGSCEAVHHIEARHRPAMLSLADQTLSNAGSLRQLRLS
jgi:hypothetical protein